MVAYYHGQIWNAAELARALAVNESTVHRYRPNDGRVHGLAIAALVRESRQTPGQSTESLQRPASRVARRPQSTRLRTSPQSRCVVGRLRGQGSPQGVAT